MADVIKGIPDLIERGKSFSFQNFASKSKYGGAASFSDEWLVWLHLVTVAAEKMPKSPIKDSIDRGLEAQLLGHDEEHFKAARDAILNGLVAAEKIFGQPIPASDRIVSLGHNSPEQTQALEQLDELVTAVKETNDFPGDAETKEQIVAELSAARRLLEAAKVRVEALKVTIGPPLKWLAEKAGGAFIGKAAGSLWEFLVKLF